MPKASLPKRKEWKKKLDSWKESGLSGPEWCKENKENYPQFLYWKSALKLTQPRFLFKELKEDPRDTIEIELNPSSVISL